MRVWILIYAVVHLTGKKSFLSLWKLASERDRFNFSYTKNSVFSISFQSTESWKKELTDSCLPGCAHPWLQLLHRVMHMLTLLPARSQIINFLIYINQYNIFQVWIFTAGNVNLETAKKGNSLVSTNNKAFKTIE